MKPVRYLAALLLRMKKKFRESIKISFKIQ